MSIDALKLDLQARRLQAAKNFKFNGNRVKTIKAFTGKTSPDQGCVVYWMHRDQRVQDNWAMIYSQQLAKNKGVPLKVVTLLSAKYPEHPGATLRSYSFCIGGLKEVEQELQDLAIGFKVLVDMTEKAVDNLLKFINDNGAVDVVTDLSPLRHHRNMVASLKSKLGSSAFHQVDARNIIPIWTTSASQEKGAFTIRNKVMTKLDEYATEFPPVLRHPIESPDLKPVDWENVETSLVVDKSVAPVDWAEPGTTAGWALMDNFTRNKMKVFGERRNDPNADAQSGLSPWFHWGQVSPHRVYLHVKRHCDPEDEHVIGFVEQLTVRRELADNFCYYSRDDYDKIDGCPDWAKKTLNDHRGDRRSYLYSRQQLEAAKTHDDLWNASQQQLLKTGKIHGYMRMYWAKMILSWSSTPEEALETAIYLNDHYSIDGCDANGYNGILWSLGGVHDKSFHDQPVFGKVRGMSYKGCLKKFDVGQYVSRFCGGSGGPKNWKFNKSGGDGGDPRQPVKVFVPSKNSRSKWRHQ